jgi:hypothetical protein
LWGSVSTNEYDSLLKTFIDNIFVAIDGDDVYNDGT